MGQPQYVSSVDAGQLTRAECEILLASRHVGRVIHTTSALPTAVPVMYAVIDGSVIFREFPGLDLRSGTGMVIAFEVDTFEDRFEEGWCVVATGLAVGVTDHAEIQMLDGLGIASWAPDQRSAYVRLTVGPLSGTALQQRAG